nr:hypothetical protein [Tanacetum cinerariifolium]
MSSRVPIPLPEDLYEALRHAYLVGTDTKSEPFEGEAETPESPHTVAPLTCHVGELKVSGMSGARSTSSDSTTLLSPNQPLTNTTPVLVPSLRRTTRMAVCVSPAMSPSLFVSIADMAAMPDLAFYKRFRGELGEEEDEEVEDRSNSDSESEDAKDEGPTAEDEDHAARDEGLAAGDEGPSMRVKSLGLGRDETIPEGQQRAAPVVETAVGQGSGSVLEPERLEGVSALRQPTLTIWIDPEDGIVYIGVPAYPPPALPVQIPPSPEWPSGELSPALFEMYDRDIEELFTRSGAVKDKIISQRYRFRILEHEKERTAIMFGALWTPVLALEAWARRVDTQIADMSWAEYDDHRLVHDMLLQQVALPRELQDMRGHVTTLEQERNRREQ